MTRTEIKFAGFGGQGIVLSGFILGRAVAIHEDRHAVLTQSYGPEARGGACSAEIVISDTMVDYPYIDIPQILVLMSQEAYMTYHTKVRKDGMIIYDKDLVNLNSANKVKKLYGIPATRIAEELGKKIVANIVMLGALIAISDVVEKDAMAKAVESSVPKGLVELNMKAFERGYEVGMEVKGQKA
ncbi:MAG: 2-oxoacid:acceptor oxidoreductase family protein [Thermoplasmata archaeon]|nr:MAG: 2-oxoacid:acceptor oxidoreductase family protein [Thermoplasmata archaeon]